MKTTLECLYKGETLTYDESRRIMLAMGEGAYSAEQTAAFLSALNMRAITPAELGGFRDAMLALAVPVPVAETLDTIDIVGTGGDGKDTFNISTLACFVVAGAGYKVLKHGNYAASSTSGSSNVLEALLGRLPSTADGVLRTLDTVGFAMQHAPFFHPAMRHIAPVRKALGVRTVFNILGPLTNPGKPSHMLIGAYNLPTLTLYQQTLKAAMRPAYFSIVHTADGDNDGYDEASLTGAMTVARETSNWQGTAEDWDLTHCTAEELASGGSIEASKAIFMNVLEGRATRAQQDVVVANAALAIHCIAKRAKSMSDCLDEARTSLANGSARNILKRAQTLAANDYR